MTAVKKINFFFLLITIIVAICLVLTILPKGLFACEEPVVTVEEPPKPRVYEKSESGFTELMYNKLLGREPIDSEIAIWSERLSLKEGSVQEMIADLVLSEEAKIVYPDLSDQKFLDHLYDKILRRQPDKEGYNTWLSMMEKGIAREDIIIAFTSSQEFEDLYADFGVLP